MGRLPHTSDVSTKYNDTTCDCRPGLSQELQPPPKECCRSQFFQTRVTLLVPEILESQTRTSLHLHAHIHTLLQLGSLCHHGAAARSIATHIGLQCRMPCLERGLFHTSGESTLCLLQLSVVSNLLLIRAVELLRAWLFSGRYRFTSQY